VLLELVERLLEHGQTLCSTVAGGCGRAEALEELFEVLFEFAESLRELGYGSFEMSASLPMPSANR
jgi:hypothetical protein